MLVMKNFLIFLCSNRVIFFIPLSSIPGFLKPGFRSNGPFAGGFVVFLDVASDFNARHVSHIHNIRLNRQCGSFQDCERFGKPFFAVQLTARRRGTFCVDASRTLALYLLAVGFWGTPASPPNSPWRTTRTGA
jgi:hypothetical protein